MKDKLKTAFLAYINKVKTVIEGKKDLIEEGKTVNNLSLAYVNPKHWLVDNIEYLEKSPEFKELVSACSEIFSEKILGLDLEPEEIQDSFFYRMQNFFCRSGCYLRIWEEDSLGTDDYFDQLWNAFSRSDNATFTFLSLLKVWFPENLVDFGSFKIQRFTKKELDDLCQNQINRVFYPEAKWDTEKLSLFWFIKEEELKSEVDKQFVGDFVLRHMKKPIPVKWEFPDQIIRQLVLFDWNSSKDQNEEWKGFSTPIVLRIDNDILWPIGLESPNVNEILPFLIVKKDSKTGEDVEYPPGLIKLEKNDLEELKKLVKDAQEFSDIRPDQWKFLGTAMGYLAHAFFTEGLEQLLWHMTVLEALFGEKSKGIEETVKIRVSNILEKDIKKRKKIRKQFDDLYKLRSELVHGKEQSSQAYEFHLWQARNLARQSVVWFLNYLLDIHAKLDLMAIAPENFPQRKEILASLDLNEQERNRLKILIEILQRQPTSTEQ